MNKCVDRHTMKAQPVRLMDVFLIGPLMMYGGKTADMPVVWKSALVYFGASTILFNGMNYLRAATGRICP